MTVPILEKATAALDKATKDPQELKAVANELLGLIRKGDNDLIAPFCSVVDALPDAAARVAIYRDAAGDSICGSELELCGLSGIVKHADALPDEAAREASYRSVIIITAGRGVDALAREGEQQKNRNLAELPQPNPVRAAEINLFVRRFGTPAQS